MDLKNLSAKQLDELVVAAGQRKAEVLQEKKDIARARILKILTDEGLTLEQLFGKRGGVAQKGIRAKVAPKYRNPKDSAQTWAGRGRKPLWVVDALKSGKKIQDLAIVGQAGLTTKSKPDGTSSAKARSKVSPLPAKGSGRVKRGAKKG